MDQAKGKEKQADPTDDQQKSEENFAANIAEYDIIQDSELDTSQSGSASNESKQKGQLVEFDHQEQIAASATKKEKEVASGASVSKTSIQSATRSEKALHQTDQACTSKSSNSSGASQTQVPSIPLPHVDCPEKIVICLDLSQEMMTTNFRSRAGDKYSGLELARRAIKMFVLHKSQMNPKHQFAFLVFKEEATMIHSFTQRAQDILNTLDESEIEPQESAPLNLSNLFETIKENVDLPEVQGDPRVIPPPYVVRAVLLFGRSHSVPISPCQKAQRELESSPYFFTDVLYIHEPPSEDNNCEEIFKLLCDLDHNGLSYIFEQSKYTQILNSGVKLLAHPLQRPKQLDAVYKIGSPVPPAQTHSQPAGLVEERVY